MVLPFRLILGFLALATCALTSYTVFAAEEVYDRLDGRGPSGKRVDVIEWDGNLEIHVYPKGSLKGLSAKLDDRTEGKKVMVIGYRLSSNPKDRPLVRRAILGVPFTAKVKGFVDNSEAEFDKLAISNQDLKKPWAPYKLDASPAQWYPDGDERNEEVSVPILSENKKQEPTKNIGGDANPAPVTHDNKRAPASTPQANPEAAPKKPVNEDNEGSVGHFSW